MMNRIRQGLPYGWWRDADFWALMFFVFVACPMLWFILAAWFLGWTPLW